MTTYGKHLQLKSTPQGKPIPGREGEMEKNYAEGYAFKADKWQQFRRFLILGTCGGTYYVDEAEFTRDALRPVLDCIREDGMRAVKLVARVSDDGLAVKNDTCIFALALCAAAEDIATRTAALRSLGAVARIPTHLFKFLEECRYTRGDGEKLGTGHALKRAVQRWYNDSPVARLAMHVVKYWNREGWKHADVLNMFRPNPEKGRLSVADVEDGTDYGEQIRRRKRLYRWIVGRNKGGLVRGKPAPAPDLPVVEGYLAAQAATRPPEWADLVRRYELTREMLPTEALRSREVWEALLERMPMTAMVRNLGNMSRVGLLVPGSQASRDVIAKLGNAEVIRRSRLHPMAFLFAMKTYASGHGHRGAGLWAPVSGVVDALDKAFHDSFPNVQPSGKRVLIGLDISGSMDTTFLGGGKLISCRTAAAALALVAAATDPSVMIGGFTAIEAWRTGGVFAVNNFFRSQLADPDVTNIKGFSWLDISGRRRLDDVIEYTKGLPLGPTDVSLPIRFAIQEGLEFDAFHIYTDNQTWAGPEHPTQSLRRYRDRTGIDARLCVVSLTSGGASIADPDDPMQMDVVGMDPGTPEVLRAFTRGEL